MAHVFKPFGCNIHAHSDCSLDGGSSVKKIVKRAKELGLGHLVLTEHGNINSAASLAMYAQEAGLPFSHGIEVYLDPPFLFEQDETNTAVNRAILGVEDVIIPGKRSYMHLTILFKTVKAYEYFCRLTPIMEGRAQIRYGERKPIIKWEELEEIGPELVIGSGCLVGFIQKFVLNGQLELAEKAYQMVRSLVQPGCFFVEVFPHCVTHEWQRPVKNAEGKVIEAGKFVANECLPDGSIKDIQRVPNLFAMSLAKKYGDRCVVSEDSHFAYPNQKTVQDARLGNGQENWRFYTSYHMRTPAECCENLAKLGLSVKDVEELVDNSYALKDVLSGYRFLTSKQRWVLPQYDGDTRKHLIELIKKHGRLPDVNRDVYLSRLKYEMKVFSDNGKADFLPYIFQVEDVSSWCNDNDVLMNLRGSAGGSLLYYLIGASVTDPIKYNLPFERHITMGRIRSNALPDADMDFSNKTKVVEGYIAPRLGDRALPLSTNMNLKVKSSIKDAERSILGAVRKETEMMCVKFPNIPQGPTEEQWLFGYVDKDTGDRVKGFWDQSEELRAYAAANPKIWEMVRECLGVMRNKGSHACGFLITPDSVHKYFPVTWVGTKSAGQLCTAFDPKSLEYAGGIKFDFLGVQTLEVIRIATRLIKQRYDVVLKWGEYPHDPEVYSKIFHSGDTAGVFQYNTNVVKPFAKKIRPMSVVDLANLTALLRPGCLDALAPDGSGRTCAEYYVAVAQGEKPIYLHPDLEPILKETNGVILYQEQLLYSYTDLGDYTLEEAEDVRRAIAKKDEDKMKLHGGNLRKALITKRGWTELQAHTFTDQLEASSRYSFNKAHAASYAIVGYNTAYLKKNFPLEFWTAELTVFGGVEEKLKGYSAMLGDLLLPPSISNSDAMAWKIEGEKIRAPLSVINGLGPAATAAITSAAPYSSIEDFAARCNGRAVNRGVFVKLVLAGLFDEHGSDPKELVSRYWKAKGLKEKDFPPDLVAMTEIERFIHKSQLNMLSDAKLVNLVGPRLRELGWRPGRGDAPWVRNGDNPSLILADVAAAAKHMNSKFADEGIRFYMVALFLGSRVETTKTGKRLLKVQLTDGSTEFEAVDWNKLKSLGLPKNTPVIVSGRIKKGYKVPISVSMGTIETLWEVIREPLAKETQ